MPGTELIEQGIKEGIQQGLKQSAIDSLQKISVESLESIFGRQIPKSYLNSTGDALTKSGARRYFRTSTRALIKEGGEDGPARALEATVKALGVSQSEAAEIVVGNLGVRLIRANADEAVMAALRGSKKTLSEIICSTPATIKSFVRSVYDNAIRLGRSPRQALKQARSVSDSIAFKRATLILGVPAAGAVVFGAGWAIYTIGSDLVGRGKEPEPSQAEESVDEPPQKIIGQSIMGLTAIGLGGVALLSVLAMGGKKENAVATNG